MKYATRHRMLQDKKRIKRRILLGLMLFCGAILGVVCLFGGSKHEGGVSLFSSNRLRGSWSTALMEHGYSNVGADEGSGLLEGQAAHQEEGRTLASASCSNHVDSIGMAVLYVFGILYCFLGLAIVCDEYFQSSLEIISDVLHLTPDVAGATFLAAGSSAPELFTSLADAFGEANSTGTGTIVGSAMFNILVIVALSAAVAGRGGGSIPIDWRPVSRDVIFYSISIAVLTLVFIDSEVQWWEGLIMTLAYGLYIVFMKYNNQILGRCKAPKVSTTSSDQALDADMAAAVGAISESKQASYSVRNSEDIPKTSVTTAATGTPETPRKTDNDKLVSSCETHTTDDMVGDDVEMGEAGADAGAGVEDAPSRNGGPSAGKVMKPDDEDEEQPESRFKCPDSLVDQVWYILSLPLLIAFTITIPDSANPKYRKWYAASFIMSLVWIGTLTHFMVEWANAVGCYAGVSPIFMGLVVLAIGTSVPDALGSMIAARGGEANMAIANAVGSNVFDVLIGLGFPWFLRGVIMSEPMEVDRDGIEQNVIILFCTAILFVGILALNRWSMNSKTGIFLFCLYLIYVISVVVQEVV